MTEKIEVDINKDNSIKLQQLGKGSSSTTNLYYHIELERLFAVKEFHISDDFYYSYEREYKKLSEYSISIHTKILWENTSL